jgi:hypothetical protein
MVKREGFCRVKKGWLAGWLVGLDGKRMGMAVGIRVGSVLFCSVMFCFCFCFSYVAVFVERPKGETVILGG